MYTISLQTAGRKH